MKGIDTNGIPYIKDITRESSVSRIEVKLEHILARFDMLLLHLEEIKEKMK